MAFLNLYRDKLRENFEFIDRSFRAHNLSWGVVSKLLCGNADYLRELIKLGVTEIHDSRLSNLKTVKKINPQVQTVYIKPPARRSIPGIVSYADVSLNTCRETLRWLSDEAVKQRKLHKVIIMVEMGDLREGVMGKDLIAFYEQACALPQLEIVGLGTNFNCLSGVMPSAEKLNELCDYKLLLERKFRKKIPWISAGTSVAFPLLRREELPAGVNHFRIGETLFFGIDLFARQRIEGMHDNVFELFAEIIEIYRKPLLPEGPLAHTPQGELLQPDPALKGKTSFRAIVDIGLLDVDPKYLVFDEREFTVSGTSSDMLVLDLADNPRNYKVGDLIRLGLKYMGALSVLNSDYIEKRVC